MTKIIWKLHAYSASNPRVVEHRRWDARLGMTRTMVSQMLGKDYGGRTVLAYHVDDNSSSSTAGPQKAPIALMAVSTVVEPWSFEPKNFVEVESIVGHPGFKGAGGALIEHAATLSQSLGHGGAVRLTPLQDANAKAAYSALGFQPQGKEGKEWELVPSSRPDKWVRQ